MLLKTQNLELCVRTNVGSNQAKIEKILISQAIQLEFLGSLVRAIQYEVNNLQREGRHIGSRAIKMLRDLLLLRARSWRLKHHLAAEKAYAQVRACTNNWSI